MPEERADEERTESAVVLVVLDGVRAQEIFGGADRALAPRARPEPLAPGPPRGTSCRTCTAMLDTDAIAVGAPGHGAEIAASGPRFISLPGYLEIFAGQPDPAARATTCDRPPAHTLADDVRESSGADDVALVTSWPNIARAAAADLSPFVVTAGRKLVSRAAVLRADPTHASLLDAARA